MSWMYMSSSLGWSGFFREAFFWIIVLLLVIFLVRKIFIKSSQKIEKTPNQSTTMVESVLDPIEILRERFARGEITKREFEEKRKILEK